MSTRHSSTAPVGKKCFPVVAWITDACANRLKVDTILKAKSFGNLFIEGRGLFYIISVGINRRAKSNP